MKRRFLTLFIAATLMVGVPVLSQAQDPYPGTTTTEDDSNAGLWGLLGLVGLLAFARRRPAYRDRDPVGTTR